MARAVIAAAAGQRRRRTGVQLLVWMVLLAGCSPASADPAFESVQVVAVSDDACAQAPCMQVRAPVLGSSDGIGTCAVFGSGDPADQRPLASNSEMAMRAGTVATWTIGVPDGYALDDLNPVCEPMIEG